MASRVFVKTTFAIDKVIQPIYTGGSIGLDARGDVLVTALGEEALLTDITTGEQLARIQGVWSFLFQSMRYDLLFRSSCITGALGWGGHHISSQYGQKLPFFLWMLISCICRSYSFRVFLDCVFSFVVGTNI